MKLTKLVHKFLFMGLVPVLLVSYSPLEVMGNERDSHPIVILAQADNSSLVSGLASVGEKTKSLSDSIAQLNEGLIKVYKKEIDRQAIDFKTPKTQLQELKMTWEQWKQQLDPKIQDDVKSIDDHLASLDKILSPLNAEIIQSQEQFEKREKIDKLKKYQQYLFGANATDDQVDGLFGKGTQQKIEQSLTQELDGINEGIKQLEAELSGNKPPESETNKNTLNESDLIKKIENLEKKNKEQDRRIQTLENQLKVEKTPQNPVETPINTTNTVSSRGKNILVPFLLLGILGGVGFFGFRKWIFLKKARANVSKKSQQFNEENKNSQPDELEYLPANKEYTQNHLPDYYHTNRETEGKSETLFNPVTTRSNTHTNRQKKAYPSQIEAEPVKVNWDDIQDEEALLSLYNNDHQALYEVILIVTTTKQSIEYKRGGYDDFPITFTQSENGNYWVTNVPELEDYYYYLVPKKTLVVNEHNYESLKYVFNCDRYQGRTSNTFVLRKAAIVSWDEQEEKFYLDEPGKIVFS